MLMYIFRALRHTLSRPNSGAGNGLCTCMHVLGTENYYVACIVYIIIAYFIILLVAQLHNKNVTLTRGQCIEEAAVVV
jgi:hypothetical protein